VRGRRAIAARAVAAAAAVALAGAAAAGGEARADRWRDAMDRVQGGAWLHYELSEATLVDEASGGRGGGVEPAARELVLAGVRLHGFASENASVAYHVGIDLAAGGTLRGGGFAYDVALFPAGVIVRAGETSIVGVGVGVGAMGAAGTLDDAITLPVEAIAEVGGGRARLLARARAAYVAGAGARQNGAPSLPFADELDATLGLRIGHHYGDYGYPTGNGYFVGAAYRELAGARFVGLAVGYSIDLATPRRFAP
jgi:hypothetical protein